MMMPFMCFVLSWRYGVINVVGGGEEGIYRDEWNDCMCSHIWEMVIE